MLHLLLLFVLADPTPLPTAIREVTLYGDRALVRREAALPAGGDFVIQGLPACLDPNNVRVRCEGGDVVNVETRERLQQTLPSERLQALREHVKGLEHEQQLAEDERDLLQEQARHVGRMRGATNPQAGSETSGRPGIGGWKADLSFLSRRAGEIDRARRENSWKREDLAQQLETANTDLDAAQSKGNVKVFDVRVSVEARAQATLEIEYLVSRSGWAPAYDLRARKSLDKVDLAYRARVWQQTGEDWNEVALALSSAQPRLGAQGPEPVAGWVGVDQPAARGGDRLAALEVLMRKAKSSDDEAEVADAAPAPRPFAVVDSQGLSVRFQLPKPATIQSREDPATLLIGEAQLAITAERQCVPAIDTTVWLRGRATNSSPWTMLPGTASVFFGADYLGPAQIGAVQPGQEFTLHLGADPALTLKREQTEDLSKGPGFLSSNSSDVNSWRLHLENHGALGAAADGSVEVVVREVLPRPSDERIEVEISKSSLPESDLARWKQDREERGIHTWVLRVPPGEKGTDLLWQRTISYPKGASIWIR
ncbi:MAG: mucoidy inhibitor MuiA family protein [Planctomycetes bacterium]|nr:mucoidy inhibitor MuiA family protein [Planctomycetota bacterium]